MGTAGRGLQAAAEHADPSLDWRAMWFAPIEDERSSELGLRVAWSAFDPGMEAELRQSVRRLLSDALGDRVSGTLLERVEVARLPASPELHGYLELADLPVFLDWKAAQRRAAENAARES